MLKKNSSKLVFFFLLLVFLSGANFVLALEVTYPHLPGVDPPQDFLRKIDQGLIPGEQALSLYVQYFYNLALWIAGVIALGSLIYGGIRYLTSSGKPEVMASAKNQLTAVFFGLLLLFSFYIIFTALNPDLLILDISSLPKAQIPPETETPLPETESINTSIDFQMPFGRIIEKIFETYISDYPEPDPKPEPRITRIENNAETTKKLTDNLLDQSEALKTAAHDCTCHSTDPENPCDGNVSGDTTTTWKCDCGGCSAILPCTCDPCEPVRGNIKNTQQKNLGNIYSGIDITQKDVDDQEYTITTSLIKEQEKTEKEVRLLKEQLDRLKRAEKFIRECPANSLMSLSHFYSKKDSYEEKNWTLRENYFWDDINNIYIEKNSNKLVPDWASFYCAISGTLQQEHPFPTPALPEEILEEESIEKILSETMACFSEAPVGEIIDRTKRVTQLLIDKMETLVEKDKELIDAVDTLEILVSQCSSKRGCERRCTCFGCLCSHHHHCIPGCKGWVYCCADSSGPYPSECKDRDEDTPCPYEEIDDQLEEIQRIHQEITGLIEGKGENKTPGEIGVLPIINEVIPEILKDLEIKVREPMKHCSVEEWEGRDVILFNCLETEGTTTPEGQMVSVCCYPEFIENGEVKQTIYGNCVEECYLEKGQEKYRECLRNCLYKLGDEKTALCINWLNFYCCNAGGTD